MNEHLALIASGATLIASSILNVLSARNLKKANEQIKDASERVRNIIVDSTTILSNTEKIENDVYSKDEKEEYKHECKRR